MPEDKKLKVTNISTGKVFMKSADEIAMIKASHIASRFSFEKEVDAPKMADKISSKKADKADDTQA